MRNLKPPSTIDRLIDKIFRHVEIDFEAMEDDEIFTMTDNPL